MVEVLEAKTSNPHELIWDNHSSYQWTYFNEHIKQNIEYFLLKKLKGRNLEVGGGWYLSYPNSAVVDLSSVGLEYNLAPSKDKHQFDLELLEHGESMPFLDNSFSSATLVSVWQYLKYPKKVLEELERVIRPGGEVYVINGQGSGLSECMVGTSKSDSISEFFKNLGYDTVIENIPTSQSIDTFQSVCVAMPERDLFGTISAIENKGARVKRDREISDNPSIFLEDFLSYEMRKVRGLLSELSTYPVTKYSRDYLLRVEAYSDELYESTGVVPLVFMDRSIAPELEMLLPNGERIFPYKVFIPSKNPDNYKLNEEELANKYDLNLTHNMGYFDQSTTKELIEYCEKFRIVREDRFRRVLGNEFKIDKFAGFVAALPLTTKTKDLQDQMYLALQENNPDFRDKVDKIKASSFYSVVHQNKQRRKINKLIETRRKILDEGVEVDCERTLDYRPYLSMIRNIYR